MNDRFTGGLIAGTIAGIFLASWSLTSKFILNWTEKSVAGFGALLSFNKPPEGTFEYIWGTIVALGTSAVFGIIFVYFILLVKSNNLYLKAIVFSAAAWFIFSDVIVPRISITTDAPFTIGTVSSASIGSVLYGIVLAYTCNRIICKT